MQQQVRGKNTIRLLLPNEIIIRLLLQAKSIKLKVATYL